MPALERPQPAGGGAAQKAFANEGNQEEKKPAAGTITAKPRQVLLSPNRRRPRQVRPPSSGIARTCEPGQRSQKEWAKPASE